MENTPDEVSVTPNSVPHAFTSPLLLQLGVKGLLVPVSTASPCVFGQLFQCQGNVLNISSSCAAVSIDLHPGAFTFVAAVKFIAPVEPPVLNSVYPKGIPAI